MATVRDREAPAIPGRSGARSGFRNSVRVFGDSQPLDAFVWKRHPGRRTLTATVRRSAPTGFRPLRFRSAPTISNTVRYPEFMFDNIPNLVYCNSQ